MKNFIKKHKKIFIRAGIVVISVAIIGGVFYGGFKIGTLKPSIIFVKGVNNMEPENALAADFSVFWQAWDMLKSQYIKGVDLKEQDMLYGAIKGLVDSTNDPHTIFLKPDDSKKFEEDVGGSFGGVGMEIGIKNDQLIVVAPLEDSPAAKAGIRADDKIIEIDHKSTSGLDVNQAVKKIRGEIGTTVILDILRNGEEKPLEISIVRQQIEVPTLKMEIKNNNIAYVQLFQFSENASYVFYKAAIDILNKNPKGIILDLRNNPGGYLEVAVNIAGWFVDKDALVVTEKFSNGDAIAFRANGNDALKNIPVVILVNKGSASASEILAGALRDIRKTKLIGEKTYGKGSVQELMGLKDGSKIKITVAQWLLPDGHNLDEDGGLAPDIEVKLTDKDIEAKKDTQLDKAIEEITKIISSR